MGINFLSDLNDYKDTQVRTFPSSARPEKVNIEMEQFYPSFRTHCWVCEPLDSFQCRAVMLLFLHVESAKGRSSIEKR